MKNSKSWNRILTGAAAVSLAIGTLAPMAFAATSATTQYNTRTMNVGSGYTAVVNGLVAQDQGHATEFLPVYYLMQGLGKLGYTVNWNGGTRVLNITTPKGVTVTAPTTAVATPGPDQMVIQLNGTNVQLAPRAVAKDPASGVVTTFAPIYYLNQALKLAGFTNTYNGQSWTLSGQAVSQNNTGTLSNLAVTNESSGDGSVTNPAVSLTGAAISLSTTLTDASGNPMPNIGVTFNVSNYGNYPNDLPTVENSSGAVLAVTTQSDAAQYTVYTNASGVASVTMTGPSGSTYAYEVQATAPYAGIAGGAVSSQPSYVEFVSNDQGGIAPFGAQATPYSATIGSPVPITITLPPNAQGQPQSNVLVTLNVTAPGQLGNPLSSHASFVTSTGAVQGPTIQVATNSSGIAQAYLADANGEPVEVSVTNLPSGVSSISSTYINFRQAGIAAKIANLSVSTVSPNIGQDAYVSGQLQDAMGNPLPNAQVLVTAANLGSNDFAYVSGTTTTTFPVLGGAFASGTTAATGFAGLAVGTPATSAYGDVVTSDSTGNFSFGVTDPRVESQSFAIYPVNNNEVAGAALSVPSADSTLAFGVSDTLSYLSIGPNAGFVQTNNNTTLTSSAQINGGGVTSNSLGADAIANANFAQIADVYVEPQNSAGHHTNGPLYQAETYNLSVNNGGEIYSINGNTTAITPAAGMSLQYVPGKGFSVNGSSTYIPSYTGDNTLTVSGTPANFTGGTITVVDPSGTTETVTISSGESLASIATAISSAFSTDTNYTMSNPTSTTVLFTPKSGVTAIANPAMTNDGGTGVGVSSGGSLPEDFEVGVINSNGGSTVLTITSGSVSSTATVNFTGQSAAQAVSFTPGNATVGAGASKAVSFTVEDANGNPVADSTAAVQLNNTVTSTDPLWVTEVNGVALTQTLNMGTSTNSTYSQVATPIPLGTTPTALNYSVTQPGVVNWTNGSNVMTVSTNAQGVVQLTLQAGGLTYPTQYVSGGTANPSNSVGLPTGNGTLYFYTNTGGASSNQVPLLLSTQSSASGYTEQGSLNWTAGSGYSAAQTITNNNTGTVTFNVPSSGTYTYVAKNASTININGGGSNANITVKASSSATVTNTAQSSTYTLADPGTFNNSASIGTLLITGQTTALSVVNTGTVSVLYNESPVAVTVSGAGTVTTAYEASGATVTGTITGQSISGLLPSSANSVIAATYGATATTVTGTLQDVNGNPVASTTVTVAINSANGTSTTTSSTGTFSVTVPVSIASGTSVTVQVYNSATQTGTATLSAPVTIS